MLQAQSAYFTGLIEDVNVKSILYDLVNYFGTGLWFTSRPTLQNHKLFRLRFLKESHRNIQPKAHNYNHGIKLKWMSMSVTPQGHFKG